MQQVRIIPSLVGILLMTRNDRLKRQTSVRVVVAAQKGANRRKNPPPSFVIGTCNFLKTVGRRRPLSSYKTMNMKLVGIFNEHSLIS